MEQQPHPSGMVDNNQTLRGRPPSAERDVSRPDPLASPLPSLRLNFGWTFAGNAIYAAGQWAALSLFAKLGGAAMLGEYALALAIASPVMMLSHLNLRTVLATDAANRHSFRDYLAVRTTASAAALLAVGAIAYWEGGYSRFTLAALVLALGMAAEAFSDLYYGLLQRQEAMHRVAQSMIARTAASLLAVALALGLGGDLLWAVAGLSLGRLAILLLWDRRVAGTSASAPFPAPSARAAILRQALPLGLILMLISLNTNLPRYAIEAARGTAELGIYAAVASFITVGGTLMNALGQSATARMARHFHEANLPAFRQLLWRMCGVAVALGLAGMLAAAVLGAWVLRLVYRPEFASHHGLLVGAMAAGLGTYLGIALGYGVTSARLFDAQLPLFAASAVVCGAASWLLVPLWGLHGAIAALAIAVLPQIVGQILLLRRALARREAASCP